MVQGSTRRPAVAVVEEARASVAVAAVVAAAAVAVVARVWGVVPHGPLVAVVVVVVVKNSTHEAVVNVGLSHP